MFVYGAGRICPCPFTRTSAAPRRRRASSDVQSSRDLDMSQLNNASVDSITLAARGLRPPPPAYHKPYIYPPKYQGPFAAAAAMERGET